MKKIYKILIFLSVSVLLFPACTDQLDLEPISSISAGSYWKSEEDAKGAINGMYIRFRAVANENYFIWGEFRSETAGRSIGSVSTYYIYYDNILDATNAGPDWKGLYSVIHDANLILSYVPDIQFNQEADKNEILAQAYAMRAFIYFLMVRTWGDLIINTEPTLGYDPEVIYKEREPEEKVFQLIKEDIDKAIDLFPTNSFPDGRNQWSLPAAYALKADVCLWTGKRLNGGNQDFTEALNALNEIEKADLQLLNNFGDIFDYHHKGNKEVILSVYFDELEGDHTVISRRTWIASDQIPADAEPHIIEALTGGTGTSYIAPTELVRKQFTDDDSRKNVSFLEIYSQGEFYASFVPKFKGEIFGGARAFKDDVVLYRYGDILLMKAEAKNALGQNPSAEINKVRERAYGANFGTHEFVNGTKEQNDEAILKERLFELVYEGKRWWDLVRFGKAFEKIPSLHDRVGQNYLLLWPISSNTLSLEPKVMQNPGYE